MPQTCRQKQETKNQKQIQISQSIKFPDKRNLLTRIIKRHKESRKKSSNKQKITNLQILQASAKKNKTRD